MAQGLPNLKNHEKFPHIAEKKREKLTRIKNNAVKKDQISQMANGQ